jgi:hypothetical protein
VPLQFDATRDSSPTGSPTPPAAPHRTSTGAVRLAWRSDGTTPSAVLAQKQIGLVEQGVILCAWVGAGGPRSQGRSHLPSPRADRNTSRPETCSGRATKCRTDSEPTAVPASLEASTVDGGGRRNLKLRGSAAASWYPPEWQPTYDEIFSDVLPVVLLYDGDRQRIVARWRDSGHLRARSVTCSVGDVRVTVTTAAARQNDFLSDGRARAVHIPR